SLPTRVPSPRPVEPSSPVRVTILLRRFAMGRHCTIAPVKTSFLDFEQPIAELEQKIEELRFVQDDSAVDISAEIERLSKKSRDLTKDIYAKLTAWQVSKVARHPQRPYTLDYLAAVCTDFEEMHGDRGFADDPAIVGGLARFN